MAYTVKVVADMAGISVRTLHHYDQIGLLKPASASAAGYRLYSEADLERLQQILFFRELGFTLREIKRIVDSPGFDRRQALAAHRELLEEKRRRLDRLIACVDRSIDALERRVSMEGKMMFDGFDEKKLAEYREEARARWGEVVDESYRRTDKYTEADWAAIGAESDEINRAMAAMMDREPTDPEVQRWIGQWFRLINDRFYECTPEVFRGLGDLYVDDGRFTEFYDKYRPGLAKFMRAAMHAYVDRLSQSK